MLIFINITLNQLWTSLGPVLVKTGCNQFGPLCGSTWTSLEQSRSGCLKSGKSKDRLQSGCLEIGVKDQTRPDFKTLITMSWVPPKAVKYIIICKESIRSNSPECWYLCSIVANILSVISEHLVRQGNRLICWDKYVHFLVFGNHFSDVLSTLLIYKRWVTRKGVCCGGSTLCKLFSMFDDFMKFGWIWTKFCGMPCQFTGRDCRLFSSIQNAASGCTRWLSSRHCILWEWSHSTMRLLDIMESLRIWGVREAVSAVVFLNDISFRALILDEHRIWTSKVSHIQIKCYNLPIALWWESCRWDSCSKGQHG